MLAAASQDGKMLRVFDINSQELVTEVCRGQSSADISCINLTPATNPDEWYLICASV